MYPITLEEQKGLYWFRKRLIKDNRQGGLNARQAKDHAARNAWKLLTLGKKGADSGLYIS